MKGFNENQGNPKKYWRHMSGFLNKNKSNNITEVFTDDNRVIKELEAAEHINNYFCEIGQHLSNQIVPTDKTFTLKKFESEFVW